VEQDIPSPAPQVLTAPLESHEEVDHGHDSHVHTFFDEDQYPAMHFEDAVQQREASTIGMWAFLATEVMLFAGLFMDNTMFRANYEEGFRYGSHALNITLGTINTFVLLASSLCVVLAVNKAQHNSNRGIVFFLILTMLFGLVFFIVKGFEWYADYEEGLVPWMNWNQELNGLHNHETKIFMVLYFIMTGTHALHMMVGMVILGVIAHKAGKGKYSSTYYTPLEIGGLYWHFVDIVWVFLVPTLYLIDRYATVTGLPHHH
jgi:cytochrome c oxidase subunit 3